ncbi:YcbK family protein [Aureimonas frigidaquae]|uniref:YcbK family protein n=1 Tax=Aureimonas frigidaquae TaxID=424757 RepID=UPI000AFF8349|nr:D-Ala-D-Ala carboxypeptidase family metallohydrolase [Aureimonas frigidaquae]
MPALLRNSVFLAGMLAFPGLSGCMSAIDESSAFGFAQNAPAAPAEGAAPAAADAAQTAAAGPAAQNAEGSAVAELAEAAPQTPPAAAAVPADGLSTQAAATFGAPRRSDALAAFATPRRQADTSLFASLSQRAEAEQPEPAAVAEEVSSRVVVTHTDGMGKPSPSAELPGVDPSSLFKIGRRASVDDEELLDDIGGSYQIASLGGMARLAPNGLMVARDDVNTSCFGSDLVRMLRQIEQRFGKKVVITSGFRSPSHNRRVRGAKASLHMACKAADLHVPGVSGLEVARYVRALPNRGGVGTYCHTAAIHVDVGKQRDWNWPCRRRG